MTSALGSVRPHSLYRRALLDEGGSGALQPLQLHAGRPLRPAVVLSPEASLPVLRPRLAQLRPVRPLSCSLLSCGLLSCGLLSCRLSVVRPPVVPPPARAASCCAASCRVASLRAASRVLPRACRLDFVQPRRLRPLLVRLPLVPLPPRAASPPSRLLPCGLIPCGLVVRCFLPCRLLAVQPSRSSRRLRCAALGSHLGSSTLAPARLLVDSRRALHRQHLEPTASWSPESGRLALP